MKLLSRVTRCLLLHVLAVSLSAAGIVPQIAAAAEASGHAGVTPPASTKCCCGTREARCCGTSCCSGAGPVQPSSPAPSKSDDSRSQTVTLALAAAGERCASAASVAFRAAATIRAGRLTPVSLQTLHVRIDA